MNPEKQRSGCAPSNPSASQLEAMVDAIDQAGRPVDLRSGSAWGTKKEGSDEWATPADLYGAYDWEFAFTLDACASPKNAKHSNFEAKDGLTRSWERERVWCNPPYSEIEPWIRRGFNREAEIAVFLVPVRQDTDWWRRYVFEEIKDKIVMKCDGYRVFRRRVRFVGATSSPAWATALVIYRKGADDACTLGREDTAILARCLLRVAGVKA